MRPVAASCAYDSQRMPSGTRPPGQISSEFLHAHLITWIQRAAHFAARTPVQDRARMLRPKMRRSERQETTLWMVLVGCVGHIRQEALVCAGVEGVGRRSSFFRHTPTVSSQLASGTIEAHFPPGATTSPLGNRRAPLEAKAWLDAG